MRETFNQYEHTVEDVFVETGKMHANVEMTFQLPDTAEGRQIWEDLNLYFTGRGWGLIPPWASDAEWPAAQRTAQTELRKLAKALQEGPSLPADAQHFQQRIAAQRRGDTAEVDRLTAQAKRETEAAQVAHRKQLEARYGHADLIQAWTDIQNADTFQKQRERIKREIAPQLGQWPEQMPHDVRALNGFAFKAPLTDHRLNCQFAETDVGLFAMTRWLFAHGASDMHYRIIGYPVDIDLDPDGD